MNKEKRLLKTGLIGSLIVGLCCFTPVLVILLAMVGLSAITAYLDIILLPALAVCIGIVGYAWYRIRQSKATPCHAKKHNAIGEETREHNE